MFTYCVLAHSSFTRYIILCHECQDSCTSVKYTQLLVKFVQLSNLPASSPGTVIFCLIMDKLFNICHECHQHNNLDM